jgi:phosphohistidine swiveling domain-containing protein
LKIPCLVAVKDATKILENGDYAEVDAISGVITVKDKAL